MSVSNTARVATLAGGFIDMDMIKRQVRRLRLRLQQPCRLSSADLCLHVRCGVPHLSRCPLISPLFLIL